jgi:hypothetical protein
MSMPKRNETRKRVTRSAALVVVGVLVAAACGGGTAEEGGQLDLTPINPSTLVQTTIPTVVTDPLTGLPNLDATTLGRPAIVVKIDNHPKARPQYGINQADLIFEQNVEKLTRFAAVFHSQGSDPVGPIRSGRFGDINLLGSLNRPLLVWSGGNAQVTNAINKSDLINFSFSAVNTDGGYRRDSSRPAPHNLIAETSKLWAIPNEAGVPGPQFSYRGESDANTSTSRAVDGLRSSMDGVKVQWTWNAGTSEYSRTQDGKPLVDPDGVQMSVPNVVILEVSYSAGYSPTPTLLGEGKAFVFTNGVLYEGSWRRSSRTEPFGLFDSAGSLVKLTPGQTFVQLSRRDKTAVIETGVDPDSVKYP